MDKQWDFSEIDELQAQSLASKLNIHPTLGALLINRGVNDYEKARTFFRPDLNSLHDPFLMKDLDIAVNRLSEALTLNQSILIYGDYDVDGTTSVALMCLFLKKFTKNICFIFLIVIQRDTEFLNKDRICCFDGLQINHSTRLRYPRLEYGRFF